MRFRCSQAACLLLVGAGAGSLAPVGGPHVVRQVVSWSILHLLSTLPALVDFAQSRCLHPKSRPLCNGFASVFSVQSGRPVHAFIPSVCSYAQRSTRCGILRSGPVARPMRFAFQKKRTCRCVFCQSGSCRPCLHPQRMFTTHRNSRCWIVRNCPVALQKFVAFQAKRTTSKTG